MKKVFIIILILVLSLAFFVSCDNFEITTKPTTPAEIVNPIRVYVEVGAKTKIMCSSTEYGYSVELSDDYLQKHAYESSLGLTYFEINYEDFDGVFTNLPSVEDVVVKKYKLWTSDKNKEDCSDWVESIEWSIITYKNFWNSIVIDKILPLTQENWRANIHESVIELRGNCVLKDDRNAVDVEIRLGNGFTTESDAYVSLDVKDSFDNGSVLFGAHLAVDACSFEDLLSGLPELDDFCVRKRNSDGEYVAYDVNLSSVVWKLYYEEYDSTNNKTVDLTEENWQYAIKHSFIIAIVVEDFTLASAINV